LAQSTVNHRVHHAKDGPAVADVVLPVPTKKQQEDTHRKDSDMLPESRAAAVEEDTADHIVQDVPATQQIDFVTLGMFIIGSSWDYENNDDELMLMLAV
jgi:hypothetical protein